MKIAMAAFGPIHLPWTAQGNAMEILTYELACHLVENCEVIVYTQREKGQKKIEHDQGVEYRRISTVGDRWFLYLSDKLNNILPGFSRARATKPFLYSKLYYLTYAIQIAKDLKTQRCDVVHLHNLSQFIPLFRAYNPDIKIILHMHSEWLSQLDRAMIEKQLKDVDLIVSCSNYITKKTCESFPQFASICCTLHNGVDIEKFISLYDHQLKKNKNFKKFLFVGRNSPEKGVHVLLNAFNMVQKKHPQVELRIVGPQGSAPVLRGRELILNLSRDPKVKKLAPYYTKDYFSLSQRNLPANTRNKIIKSGFVRREKLIKYYQEADIFIFPPVWEEPFGMPVVEAMATGTPVVSTRVGGINEIVEDGRTGLLVEPRNESALAQAILHLLEDEEMRKSMGMAARTRAVEHFSWDHLAKVLLGHYDAVLSKN